MTTPLRILYQDQLLIAVDKPAGQLVHPADLPHPGDEVTLKILRDQIGATPEQLHLIHRLDRPTTGVLLFGRDKQSARRLRAAFDKREISKTYHAIIVGHPAQDTWTCDEPLQKDESSPLKSASTSFRVLARLAENLAHVEARPHTGRFHQIRRHLLHTGHPIVGDYRYLGIETCDTLGARLGIGTRMLLQAKVLELQHPGTGEPLTITAPTDSLFTRLF